MTSKLSWFTVRLALLGLPEDQAAQVVKDLREELAMHSYLRNPQITWDTESQRAIIQVDTEDFSPEPAVRQIQEEMMEILAAVLWETEGTRFEILDVTRTHPQSS